MKMAIAAVLMLAPIAAAQLKQDVQVKLPPYTREVLPNGVVLLLVPKPGVPLVQFRVTVKGGTEAAPAQLAGLGDATAALLRKGTATRSAQEFSSDLDFLGGSFSVGGSDGTTVIDAEFLSKDFDQGLDLLADALFHPTFPEGETTKELALRLDRAKALKDNAQQAIALYARAAFFGKDHPYGEVSSETTVARLRREDILAHYQRLYVGRNLIVTVAGDFNPGAVRPKLAEVFGAVPAGEAFAARSAPALVRRNKLVLVNKPDATQTYFQILQPGIDRRHPDSTVLDIVNTLFGGRFTSMLNDELRVNSGLTYGARSTVQRGRLPGSIAINTYTETATTVQAIDLALEVLDRLRGKGFTAEQLASAKAYIKGTFPTSRLESSDQVAVAVTELELYGLTRDEIDGYFARLDAVTLESTNAAARKYYQRENLTFVLLGQADKIRDGVRKYAENLTEVLAAAPGFGNE